MTESTKRAAKDLVGAKRWAAYAAAGAASVVGTQAAEAAITHVVVNATITIAGSTQAFPLGGAGTLLANVFSTFSSGGAAVAAVYNGSIAGFSASGFPYASNLASGQNVSTANFGIGAATATLAYGLGYGNDQFLDRGGFLGFRFDGGAGTQYGWARLELLNGSPFNEYTIVDYAYGDVGDAIQAGQVSQVPLPGSLWFLASGAAGLIGWRKARNMSIESA